MSKATHRDDIYHCELYIAKLTDVMRNSQFVRLLLTLSSTELKQFHRYLQSPYFNSHEDTLRLFERIVDKLPEYESTQFESEAFFAALFPGQAYKDDILRTLRKYLLQHLKQFLTLQHWEKDHHAQNRYLLDALSRPDREADFTKQLKKSQLDLEKEPYEDAASFLYHFALERIRIDFEFKHGKRKVPPSMERLGIFLDYHYLAEQLQFIASARANQKIVEMQVEAVPLQAAILTYVEEQLETLPPVIQLYFLACQFLEKDHAEPAFSAFRKSLQNHASRLYPSDLVNLYSYGIKYANQRYLRGAVSYLAIMFELYNQMLQQELLFEGKNFSLNNFKNLCTLGLRLRKLEWTEHFIESYKEYLREEHWESVYHYNLAHLRIYQKKYREAIRLLQSVVYLDTFYQLGTKMLQLKIFFETDDVEGFFTLSKTFETHIKRQKEVPEHRKKAFLHFIRVARALFRIRIGERENLVEIPVWIEQFVPLIEKEWLLDHLHVLQSR